MPAFMSGNCVMAKRSRKRAKERRAIELSAQVWVPLALMVLSILLYVNTLGHDFVFDDVTLIQQNPQIVELDWQGMVWKGGYRPIRTLTYALNFAVGGQDPFGYHLVNVALHACNAALVFLLLWLLTHSNLLAGVAGLVFAVHPLQTAAVAYISGRKDLLAAFFLLLALSAYLVYRRRTSGRRVYLVLSAVCFLLAVLSKEVALVFPGMLLLVDSFLEAQQQKKAGGQRLSLFFALWRALQRFPVRYLLCVVVAVFGAFWVVFINEASRMQGYWGGTLWTNVGTSFKLFVHYLRLSVFPHPLVADYLGEVFPVSSGFLEFATLAALGVTVFYLVACWTLFRRSPLVSFGMIWFFVTLLPVLQFVPFHELAADHFGYLPLVGFACVAAVGFSSLLNRFSMQLLVWATLVLVVVVFSLRVLDRNRDWKSSETLWEATYRDAPGSYRANTNLGEIYFRRGLEGALARSDDVQKGLQMTERSIELDPSRAVSWGNLGAMNYTLGQRYREAGDLVRARSHQDRAVAHFEQASRLEPENPFTQGNLANAYKELGNIYEAEENPDKALEARKQAVEIYSKALDTKDRRHLVQAIWLGYGGVFIDAGYYDQAINYLRQYLIAYPENPTGNYWMGFCLAETGSYENAIFHLEKAVRGRPGAESWGKLAYSYQKVGELEKAVKSYQAALRVQPNSTEVHYQLGVLYKQLGDEARARTHLTQALNLDPAGERSVSIKRLLEDNYGVKVTPRRSGS